MFDHIGQRGSFDETDLASRIDKRRLFLNIEAPLFFTLITTIRDAEIMQRAAYSVEGIRFSTCAQSGELYTSKYGITSRVDEGHAGVEYTASNYKAKLRFDGEINKLKAEAYHQS